jgi:hypothetical protein
MFFIADVQHRGLDEFHARQINHDDSSKMNR